MSSAFNTAPDDSNPVAGTQQEAPKLNLKGTFFPLLIIYLIPSSPKTFAISCGSDIVVVVP